MTEELDVYKSNETLHENDQIPGKFLEDCQYRLQIGTEFIELVMNSWKKNTVTNPKIILLKL